MECFSCLLRYNLQARNPLILSCGHSLCAECLPNFKECPICEETIRSNPRPNYSLLEMISKDNKPIDKFIKVCFVGSSAVGKTSLIRQFTSLQFSQEVATTIGYDFTFRDRNLGNYCVRFQLWDSAGQERYRAISPIHYKNAHVVIIVYNMSCSAMDNRVAEWIQQAEKHAPKEALKVVVGNKSDLITQGKMCKPLDDEAWDMIKQKKIFCCETSCKSGNGIQMFWQVLENYFYNRKDYEQKMSSSQTTVSEFNRKSYQVSKNSSMQYNTKLKQRRNSKNSKKQQCC